MGFEHSFQLIEIEVVRFFRLFAIGQALSAWNQVVIDRQLADPRERIDEGKYEIEKKQQAERFNNDSNR